MSGGERIIVQVSYTKEDFPKICRFCLAETNPASLVKLSIVKYETIFIIHILEGLFGSKIILNDELPENVCLKCIAQIIRCYHFKKTYDTSNLILQAIILNNKNDSNTLCLDDIKLDPDETISPADDVSLAQEECKQDSIQDTIESVIVAVTDDTKTEMQAEKCDSSTSDVRESGNADPTIEDLISRQNDNTLNEQVTEDPRILEAKRYRCACGEIFSLESELLEHKKENKHKSSPKSYYCVLCDKFFDRCYYEQHLRSHNKEKVFLCEICSGKFSHLRNLRKHIRTKHSGEKKTHVCETCDKRFFEKTSLNLHMRIHTGETPYLCHVCGKRFRYAGNFFLHKQMHKDKENFKGKSYICQYCGKALKTNITFKKHLYDVHNQGSYKKLFDVGHYRKPCKQCGKVFSSPGALRQHMIFHGERKFPCDLCDKIFPTNGSLKSHTLVHTGVKAFSCDVCFRKFSHLNSLTLHMRTHTGVKPYRCKYCSKAFTQSSGLNTHVRRLHTGERPYVCEYCNKGFADSGALGLHVRIHTGERPYSCDLCSKAFHHSSTMKKHRQIHFK